MHLSEEFIGIRAGKKPTGRAKGQLRLLRVVVSPNVNGLLQLNAKDIPVLIDENRLSEPPYPIKDLLRSLDEFFKCDPVYRVGHTLTVPRLSLYHSSPFVK
jgi:hypothetical protein